MSAPFDPRIAHDFDVVGAVKQATEGASKRKGKRDFSFSHATPGETGIAIAFGLYLAYAVGRLPEVFSFMNVPRLPMIMMLIFLGMLVMQVPRDVWASLWQRSTPMRCVVGLGILGIATAPIGIWMMGSITFFRSRYVIALAIFFCSLVFLRDRRNFRRAIAIYVLGVTAIAGNVLQKTYTAPKAEVTRDQDGNLVAFDANAVESSRVTVGVSLDPNDFGAMLVVTFPLALWLGIGNARRRLFWSLAALILVGAVVPTASRGAMIGFGAVAIALIAVGSRGWRRIVTILMIVAGGAIFMATANDGQMDRFTDFGTDDYNLTSSQGRLHFWKQGFVWMLKRPTGYGIDNFPTYFGYMNGKGRAAHSLWVQYGMELGVAGLGLYVLLLVILIRKLLDLRRRMAALGPGARVSKEEEGLAGHALAMLAGLIVTSTFLSMAYAAMTYMCLGIAAATLLGSTVPELPPGPRNKAPAPKPATGRVRAPALMTRGR